MTRVPGIFRIAAVAAGPEGGVDIDAAVARGEQRDRLAAEDGNMTRVGRIHARLRARSVQNCGNWTPTAHCASNIRGFAGPFRREKPVRRSDCRSRAAPLANPDFPTECCWAAMGFRASNGASAVPKTGSALHHLVTAVSVKKTLMGRLQLPGFPSFRGGAKHRTRNLEIPGLVLRTVPE